MNQMVLFGDGQLARLPTFIERKGDVLEIPEGLHTIPFTHGIHRFPGKFIPNLPRFLIREFLDSSSKAICDPFCGSGTTLIEAALEGREFWGIDIDPLAVLVAKAKVTPLTLEQLEDIRSHWRGFKPKKLVRSLVPDVPNLSHWFQLEAIEQLSVMKAHCLELAEPARTFCLVVFSSILRRVSNADDQTQKTYVSHTLKKQPPKPSELFPIFLERALDGMQEYSQLIGESATGIVRCADATRVPKLGSRDIITSPPYIDSVDYVYNQMLEYFWLLPELGLKNYDAYRAFRKVPMGFQVHRADAFRKRLTKKMRGVIDEMVKSIAAKSAKEAAHVISFFDDFAKHCESCAKAQSAGRQYHCIVGESTIRGVTVPTPDLMAELFQSAGYELKDRFRYEIRRHYMKFPRRSNSGTIKQDHILILTR
jgi:hypothetical protein